MWPVPDGYAAIVRASNSMKVTVDVIRAGVVIYPALPVISGTVTVDRDQAARRRCDLVVGPALPTGVYTADPALPATPDAPLGHYGQELRIVHTLVAADGSTTTIPVARCRIDGGAGSELGRSEVRVIGYGRESYVADDEFTSPRTVSGPSAASIITTLILETLPQAEVTVTATHDHGVAPVTEERSRWGLIQTLADSIAAQVYADPTGRFVITDAPTVDMDPVWRFEAGEYRSLVDATRTSSRREVRNAVAVIGSTPDGSTTPVRGYAQDDDAASPTRYGDPDAGYFGRSTLTLSHPELTREADCIVVAQAELARRTGAASSLDLSAVPHAGLEALDVVEVAVGSSFTGGPAVANRHVVDSFVLPLTPGGAFPVSTRELRSVT